ncbi:MAG: crossover junction endodeoxyribonuclease RuvC [Phycisphaerales bacterium]
MNVPVGVRILGIDPGLRVTGYACLERPLGARGDAARLGGAGGGVRVVEAGVIRLKPTRSISHRLAELDADLAEIFDRTRPAVAAVEKLYAHYKHPTTAIVMGHARGVVLLSIRRAGVELVELGATQVKKSLTGNGHAGKGQMQEGVRVQLGLNARPEPADVADAMAIALCALRRR